MTLSSSSHPELSSSQWYKVIPPERLIDQFFEFPESFDSVASIIGRPHLWELIVSPTLPHDLHLYGVACRLVDLWRKAIGLRPL